MKNQQARVNAAAEALKPPCPEPTDGQWVIMIKVKHPSGEDITNVVGPFGSEEVADRYCRIYLEPNMHNATFHLEEVANPEQFVRDMLATLG